MKSAYIVSIGKGLESFIYREIEEMENRGIKISLFATKYKGGDIFSPKVGWDVERLSYFRIFPAMFYFLFSRPNLFFQLVKQSIKYKVILELLIAFDYAIRMKKKRSNHIHCHFGDRKYFIGYFCKKLTGLPLSLTVHAHELYANPNEPFFRTTVHAADKIVAISRKNQEILINDFGVDPKKIEVIRLSIDLQNFKRTKTLKILTVARYTERKGFHELFKAIKLLDDDNIEFITVGFGDLNLQKLAISHGIEERVTIFNKMDPRQLKYFYNTCDIFCLPSKTTEKEGAEGIPVVLMEAMASEMLIVTTPNGSIPELVDEIIVAENNTEALVEGLKRAIREVEDNHFILGSKNREKVLTEYSGRNIDTLKHYLYE